MVPFPLSRARCDRKLPLRADHLSTFIIRFSTDLYVIIASL